MKSNKIRSVKEKELLVQSFLSSGQSIGKWCRENDIPATTFHAWVKKHKDHDKKETTFIELKATNKKKSEIPLITNINHDATKVVDSEEGLLLVLELGKCKLSIPQEFKISYLNDVLKVVVNLDF